MKWLRQRILTAIGAHRDHGGDGCNRDIAVAARWAEMALDDGLSCCRDSQMQARQ